MEADYLDPFQLGFRPYFSTVIAFIYLCATLLLLLASLAAFHFISYDMGRPCGLGVEGVILVVSLLSTGLVSERQWVKVYRMWYSTVT